MLKIDKSIESVKKQVEKNIEAEIHGWTVVGLDYFKSVEWRSNKLETRDF